MQQFVEFGVGIVIGAWVLIVIAFSVVEMRARLKNMRVESEAREQFKQEKRDNHRNGDDRVA